MAIRWHRCSGESSEARLLCGGRQIPQSISEISTLDSLAEAARAARSSVLRGKAKEWSVAPVRVVVDIEQHNGRRQQVLLCDISWSHDQKLQAPGVRGHLFYRVRMLVWFRAMFRPPENCRSVMATLAIYSEKDRPARQINPGSWLTTKGR